MPGSKKLHARMQTSRALRFHGQLIDRLERLSGWLVADPKRAPHGFTTEARAMRPAFEEGLQSLENKAVMDNRAQKEILS